MPGKEGEGDSILAKGAGLERPTVFLFAGESRVLRFILKGKVRMKKSEVTKLLAVTWLICVCTLYTSLSHAGTISDNFDGASINKRLWAQWNADQNQRCRQEGGELKIQIDGASTAQIILEQELAAIFI